MELPRLRSNLEPRLNSIFQEPASDVHLIKQKVLKVHKHYIF
jgi:hypothetical protein